MHKFTIGNKMSVSCNSPCNGHQELALIYVQVVTHIKFWLMLIFQIFLEQEYLWHKSCLQSDLSFLAGIYLQANHYSCLSSPNFFFNTSNGFLQLACASFKLTSHKLMHILLLSMAYWTHFDVAWTCPNGRKYEV